MRRFILTAVCAMFVGMPAAAFAQDVQSIIQTMQDKQRQRWQGLESYVVDQTMDVGAGAVVLYEKHHQDGDKLGFRLVDPAEIHERVAQTALLQAGKICEWCYGLKKAEVLTVLDESYKALGRGFSKELGVGTDNPVTTDILGGVSEFFTAAATPTGRMAGSDKVDAEQNLAAMSEFAEKAELFGTDMLNGREVYHLVATGLNRKQVVEEVIQEEIAIGVVEYGSFDDHPDGNCGLKSGGQPGIVRVNEFVITEVALWIDTETHVQRRLRILGESKTGKEYQKPHKTNSYGKYGFCDFLEMPGKTLSDFNETDLFEIELTNSDYRKIGLLYEPYKVDMRISSGFMGMDDDEIAKLSKAKAEFETVMAKMTPEQKKMIPKSMLDKIKNQIQDLVDAKGFHVVTTVNKICPGGIGTWIAMSMARSMTTATGPKYEGCPKFELGP